MPEQTLGWLPLGLGLVVEDEISCTCEFNFVAR